MHELRGYISVTPTSTPISRLLSLNSFSERPNLIQAGEIDDPIVLADELRNNSSFEER